MGRISPHRGDLNVFMEAALKRTKLTRRTAWTEPTTADLAEIEREWPLIDAEMALVDAEIRNADRRRRPD